MNRLLYDKTFKTALYFHKRICRILMLLCSMVFCATIVARFNEVITATLDAVYDKQSFSNIFARN